jgi:hypothetical protein
MSWARWSDDTRRNQKIRAVPLEARWLNFAMVGECKFNGWDGVFKAKTALAVARDEGVSDPVAMIRELTTAFYQNPLWHTKGDTCEGKWCAEHLAGLAKDEYLIHDFKVYRLPASLNAKERVAAHRARKRAGAGAPELAVLPGGAPAAPADPDVTVTPEEGGTYGGGSHVASEDNVSGGDKSHPGRRSTKSGVEGPRPDPVTVTPEARASDIAKWWAAYAKTAKMPLVKDCRAIAAYRVPLDVLLPALEREVVKEGIRSLSFFTSPEGVSRLERIQSEYHRNRGAAQERGKGPAALGELLGDFGGKG